MNLFLLASVNYPRVTQYINSLYDQDNWVLNSELLGTHLNDHLYRLNDQGEDPDPVLTQMIVEEPSLLNMFVPVMQDNVGGIIHADNGIDCYCPIIMLINRVHYDHFYRQ